MKLFIFTQDELKGGRFDAFVGLSAKSYCMKSRAWTSSAPQTSSKLKGVVRGYRKWIPFEAYLACIEGIRSERVLQYSIQAKSHEIRTVGSYKTSVNTFDDKRYIMPCNVHSLAYGSVYIEIVEKSGKCIYCNKSLLS